MNNTKSFILPMALASFCVEQISAGSLSCNDVVNNNVENNSHGKIFIEPQNKVLPKKELVSTKTEKDDSSNTLYNRNILQQQNGNKIASIKKRFDKKIEPSATSQPKSRPKQIIKKVKDIKISNTNDTKKVSKNRVATLKNYKKLTQKIKEIQKKQANYEKLKLRLKLAKENFAKKDVYIVQKGDTLRTIAKKLGVKLSELVRINKLYKTSHIKIGQKIYYSRSRTIKKQAKKDIPFKGKRVLRVTATAYTSHPDQTDSTPFLAAWNNRIRPGMKIIAVSPDLIKKYKLTNGVKVRIKGLKGVFTVRDKMNKKFKRRIDIYMGLNKKKALEWGKKEITLIW